MKWICESVRLGKNEPKLQKKKKIHNGGESGWEKKWLCTVQILLIWIHIYRICYDVLMTMMMMIMTMMMHMNVKRNKNIHSALNYIQFSALKNWVRSNRKSLWPRIQSYTVSNEWKNRKYSKEEQILMNRWTNKNEYEKM